MGQFPPIRLENESGNVNIPAVLRLMMPDWVGLIQNGRQARFNPYRLLTNYIGNPEAWQNTDGWIDFTDPAAATPDNGTGGAAHGRFTRSTAGADIVRNLASFKYDNQTGNRQGEGVEYPFNIDPVDQGKSLEISVDYFTTGAYVNGDISIFVYDITNSNLITPTTNALDASAAGQSTRMSWTAAANSTSYRLLVYVSGTTSTAWTISLSQIRVGPELFNLISGGGGGAVTVETYFGAQSTSSNVPAGSNHAIVMAIGGGGGGGGSGAISNADADGAGGGGGGGSGGYGIRHFSVTPLASNGVVVGGGGTGGARDTTTTGTAAAGLGGDGTTYAGQLIGRGGGGGGGGGSEDKVGGANGGAGGDTITSAGQFGGAGGGGNATANEGAGGSGGANAVEFNGGVGGSGAGLNEGGGGGGGGASPWGAGGNGGNGGTQAGGGGGNGANNGASAAGTAYGAGGGGAGGPGGGYNQNGNDGGNGADGAMIIIYF